MTTTITANRLTLLLAHTDGATSSAGSLGVLTSNTETPVVTQTTVGTDLLETLQILTQLAFHAVCQNLRVLAVDNIALSVQEPRWDLVLGRVLDNGDDSLEFFGSDFTGAVVRGLVPSLFVSRADSTSFIPLIQVDIGFLANKVGVAATDTLDSGQGVHDFLLAIDVGVQQPQDELDCRQALIQIG